VSQRRELLKAIFYWGSQYPTENPESIIEIETYRHYAFKKDNA